MAAERRTKTLTKDDESACPGPGTSWRKVCGCVCVFLLLYLTLPAAEPHFQNVLPLNISDLWAHSPREVFLGVYLC